MERLLYTKIRHIVVLGGIAATLAASGCGSSNGYENKLRPPSPIVVTAFISDTGVSVSPKKFGAGPVNLVITNQSHAAQQVTFASSGASDFIQQTGPIQPQDTATLRANIPEGRAVVKVDTSAIKSASITVGAERETAQNQLLQP